MDTKNTEEKQGSHLYKPGQSGNPAGRPAGSLNKATIAAQTLLDGEAEALTRKTVELALSGNIAALKLCLERICPPKKEKPLAVEFPAIESASELPLLTFALINAVGNGEVDSVQATALAALIENYGKALERTELEKRISALEAKQ